MFSVAYPKKWLKLQDGRVRVPLGNQVKAWFGMDAFWVEFPTNLRWEAIRELRILPRHGVFYLEWVYAMPPAPKQLDPARALGIDHGVNNWLTCVSNVGHGFIIDGRKVKSFNQWYNKQLGRLRTGKPQGFWSQQLDRITEKRNRRMRDAIHKAARLVVDYCLKHSIGRVIFGWNKGQKQECQMGKVNNQNFVAIPTGRLQERMAEHPLVQETLNYTEYSVQYVQYGQVPHTQRSIKVLWGMFTHPTAMGKTRMDQCGTHRTSKAV